MKTLYSDCDLAQKEQGRKDNPWHTGIPTEDGWYLIAYREFPNTPIKYAVEPFENGKWLHFTVDRLSWQKIEPYKED